MHGCQRAYRGKPLSEDQEISNKAKSRVGARVEHVFGHMQNSMGGIFVRAIGIARARVGGAVDESDLQPEPHRGADSQQGN